MPTRPRHARRLALVGAAALLAAIAVAPSALSGTGAGATFHLGRTNSVNKATILTGSTDTRMLQVTNSGTGSALSLTTGSGVPPMKVSSSTKVANLNADLLDGQSSSAFVPASGQIAISANRSDWLVTNSSAPITTDYGQVESTRFTRSESGYNYLRIGADLPVALFGREVALTAVDVCYGASASAELSDVWVYVSSAVTNLGGTSQAFADATNRTDTACRRYTMPAPVALAPTDSVTVRLGVTWTAAVAFSAGRVTFYLAPTGNEVAGPAAGSPSVRLEPATGEGPAED